MSFRSILVREPPLDVRATGAKLDGVSDDTAALLAAIAKIPSAGGEVRIPGSLKVTQTIAPGVRIWLVGEGGWSFNHPGLSLVGSEIWTDQPLNPIVQVDSGGGLRNLGVDGRGVALEAVRLINGNPKLQSVFARRVTTYGIHAAASCIGADLLQAQVYMDPVLYLGSCFFLEGSDHILDDVRSQHPAVAAVFIDAAGVQIENSHFSGGAGSPAGTICILLRPTASRSGLQIVGSYLDQHGGHSIELDSTTAQITDVIIDGNWSQNTIFTDNTYSFVHLRNPANQIKRVLIEGNAIKGTAAASFRHLVEIDDNTRHKGVIVRGNVIAFAESGFWNLKPHVTGGNSLTNDAATNTHSKDQNSGANAIGDGGLIPHGLAAAPTTVRVTPTVAGEIASVTAVDANNITVAIKTNAGLAGTNQTIYWEAEL